MIVEKEVVELKKNNAELTDQIIELIDTVKRLADVVGGIQGNVKQNGLDIDELLKELIKNAAHMIIYKTNREGNK